jgi:hypothetical protein
VAAHVSNRNGSRDSLPPACEFGGVTSTDEYEAVIHQHVLDHHFLNVVAGFPFLIRAAAS